jgi:threonine dehydrogenase-like Zn-dependent dehydrogenase
VRAVVWRAPGRVEVADVPDARVEEPGDAVVRIATSAICGSDLHFLHAKSPLEPGDVMGHEAVGVVEAVGDGVTRFGTGQRVVVAFNIGCGRCWFCRAGQTSLCEDWRNLGAGIFGGGLRGAQAELVRVPVADLNLLEVPDGVEDDRAVFVGDVLSTAVHAVDLATVEPGDVVAVMGAGPLGSLAVQAVMAHEPASVIAIDLEPARLKFAERTGAVPVNAIERNPQTAVSEHTDGRGADAVIEAVGSAAGFTTALDVVRRGGRVVVAGVYATEVVEAQLGVWWARAIDLRFTGVCPVHSVWERTMAEVVAGRLDPRPLISHRLSLEEAPRGYELFDRREATKVLLRP